MSYAKDYLKKRGNNFYFYRRVPKDLREQIGKEFVTYTLKTDSGTKAKELAAIHNRNIETYWDSLRSSDNDAFENYKAAQEAAKLYGYRYQPAKEIADGSLEDIMRRVKDVSETPEQDVKRTTLLGATDAPTLTMSEAQDHYFNLTKDAHLNKNEDQLRRWKNPVKKAVRNWIEVIGDKALEEYTRRDALEFRQWWIDRVQDENLTAGSANKDLGKLNKIWTTCDEKYHMGLTPIFTKIRLDENQGHEEERHPFERNYIKETLLNPEILKGLNFEARMCIYQMASTGCGPSELCGLLPEEIHLQEEIPHIELKFNKLRRLKNNHRKRVIPLHGSALWAFKQMPNGYETYKGKNTQLSSVINKFFNNHNLKPTPHHSLYSLRHSFQDKLTALEVIDRVQADLMGHKFNRPKYGDGAALKQNYEVIKKVTFEAPRQN